MTRMRPHELTLQVLNEVGKTATPGEIDQHVNLRAKDGSLGEYAGKHVWFLRKLGFDIVATKDGRTVLSYTLQGEPENAAEIRAGRPAKVKATKAPKAPRPVKEKVVKAKAEKVAKVKAPKVAPVVTEDVVDEVRAEVEAVRASPKTMNEDRLRAFREAKARLAAASKVEPEVPTLVETSDWDYEAAVNARMLGLDVPVRDIREEM